MIVIRKTSDANALPAIGTSYTPNLAWASAGQINSVNRVVYRTSGNSAGPVTGLTAETQYTITAYEYNNAGNCYNRTSPPSTTRYTLSTEPNTQPGTGFTSTSCTTSAIDLTFPAASGITNADGYIIVMNAGSTPANVPADGQAYSVNDGIVGDTIKAIINSTSATTATISGLNAGVNYYFTLIPYNANSGVDAQTFNYKTNGSILSTNVTTFSVATSTTSTVTTDAGYSYTSNINYTTWQSTVITNTGTGANGSVGVHEITIRDGGASADADAFATLLAGITFTYTGTANTIRQAALFTNSNAKIRNATSIGANTITFGLPDTVTLRAPDNDSIKLILRVTFNTTVTDNDKLVFTVSSVTSGSSCTYSQLTSPTAVSDNNTGNDRNRIEVTATQIAFVQQPTNTSKDAIMSPSPTVKGTDANGNTDLDLGNVTITSTGTMTGDPITVAASTSTGIATFGSVVHTVASPPSYTLTATAGALTVTSNTFDILNFVFVTGDYRSTGSGTWLTTGSTSTWDRYGTPNPGWNIGVTRPSTSTTSRVFIYNNIDATSIAPDKVFIRDGGKLTIKTSCTVNDSLKVESGGTLQIDANLTIGDASGPEIFEVDSAGTVNVNFEYSNPNTSLWKGTEIFHRKSDFVLKDWDFQLVPNFVPDNTTISTNTYNGYTAIFGNLIFDFDTRLRSSDDMILVPSGCTVNIAHGDLIYRSNDNSAITPLTADLRFSTTGTVTTGIGGDFIVENTYGNNLAISLKSSGTLNFTINGSMNLDAATTRIMGTSSGGTVSNVNINGDLIITSSAVLDFNGTSTGASPAPVATINLKGDLSVPNTGALLQNSNNFYNGILNFTGTGDGLTAATTQTIDIASTSTSENKYTNFFVKSGAYVQQINRDFELGNNDTLTIENGGIFDFGFNGTTPLLTKISGSQTGSTFRSLQGSTLKITSPDGITTTAGTGAGIGNVQTLSSKRSYDQLATFHYIGKANQVTGNAITSGTTGKIIICDLIDNTKQLTFTDSTGVSNNTTLSPTGGKLDIRRGQVIETTTGYIKSSSGTLYMSPGTLYQIAKGNNSAALSQSDPIPRMGGSSSVGINPYVLTGGTIELTGTGSSHAFQTFRSNDSRPYYQYVKFSGANTFGTDYKNMTGNVAIDSALIITGSTVVDCITNVGTAASFDSLGGLIMDGGRLRIKKLLTTNPALQGINLPYTLTGGTIEFYGSRSLLQQQIRGNYNNGASIVEYYNLEVNADTANYSITDKGNVDLTSSFTLKGTMNVNPPAVLRMDETDFIYKYSGNTTNNVNINSGAGLIYSSPYGITTVASGGTGTVSVPNATAGNIRTSIRTFDSNANYGFAGSGSMVSGDGLPSTVKALHVLKGNASDRVTLTNTVRADSSLKMYNGHLITGNNRIELGSSTTNLGTLDYTTGYIVGNMRRWFNNTNTGISTGLFPMGQDTFSNLYSRHYYIQFTSAPTTGGYLDVNFNNNAMGAAGIPIMGIPAVGGCSTFDVLTTEDEGYWIGTPQTSTLSNGAYTLALTGENFSTITDLCELTLLKRVGAGSWTTPGTHLAPTGTLTKATVSRSGISGFSNFGFGGGPPNPLPVELISFIGNCIDERSVMLTWKTASELNSKEFIVQRSIDGTHFTNVQTVAAAGFANVPKSYAAADSDMLATNSYYRLTQIDNNGAQTIFPLIQVRCNETETLHVFNTPQSIIVELNSAMDKQVAIHVFEISGKLLHTENKQVQTGFNKLSINFKKQLAEGIYIIQVVDGSNIHTTKVSVH